MLSDKQKQNKKGGRFQTCLCHSYLRFDNLNKLHLFVVSVLKVLRTVKVDENESYVDYHQQKQH